MIRRALVRWGLAMPVEAERRARRDVNLTTVAVAAIAGGVVLGIAWLAVALDQSRQGLDVRPMLAIHVTGKAWAELAGFISAVATFGHLLRRTNATERLAGRDVPDAIAELRSLLEARDADCTCASARVQPPQPPGGQLGQGEAREPHRARHGLPAQRTGPWPSWSDIVSPELDDTGARSRP